ncbi:MAG: efflux RND transporter periplasmic adaptor subunit [Thermoanaerobaculales bacterium]|jgi:multidrug efflux system membrane fusion protein|nr:efflux RND transporter periplasmic adaptor subunit [Thermoanaerobaculales bacterium]
MTRKLLRPCDTKRGGSPRPLANRLLISDPGGTMVATLLLAFVAGTAGCGGAEQVQRGAPLPVPVAAATVELRTMPISFRAIGNVEAIETVAVKARIGGELLRVLFREGELVRRGDVLFVIDPRPYEAALAQAEAMLARDQALLGKAEADIGRYASLVGQDFVTKEQYDQVLADAAALKAAVAADQAAVVTARLNLEYCTILAPVTGRAGNLNAKVGNLIKANDDRAMVTINQIAPIKVSFSVPAQHLAAVLAHRRDGIVVIASLPADPAGPLTGELSFVDNAVDTSTSTILLKATFANAEERLWPGQFVDVTVVLGEESGRVVCPAPAVMTGQDGQHVFVIRDDRSVELRPVQVNRVDGPDAVIDRGLSAGETVVTDGQLRLVPGSVVDVKGAPGTYGRPS